MRLHAAHGKIYRWRRPLLVGFALATGVLIPQAGGLVSSRGEGSSFDIFEGISIPEDANFGDDATFAEASERAGNLGSFVRRLVGLDREAAKAAFADFLDDKRYSRAQIDFVNLIIDELTRHGEISPARIYESPYTGMAPEGPETIFTNDDLDRLFATIETFANREKTN